METPSPRSPSNKEIGHDGIAAECKVNPIRFQDMPYEVTKVIIEHANPSDRYNLLFTCKVSPANDRAFSIDVADPVSKRVSPWWQEKCCAKVA